MISPEERLNEFIEEYKKNWHDAMNNMKNYYDNEDEYWWVIEQLLDKIIDLESEVN